MIPPSVPCASRRLKRPAVPGCARPTPGRPHPAATACPRSYRHASPHTGPRDRSNPATVPVLRTEFQAKHTPCSMTQRAKECRSFPRHQTRASSSQPIGTGRGNHLDWLVAIIQGAAVSGLATHHSLLRRSMRQRTRLADGSFAVVWVKKSPGRIGQGFSLITAEQEARQILSIFPSERARLPPPPERSIEPQHAPPGLPVRHIPDRVDLLQGEIAHRGNPPSLPLRRRRVA